MDTLFSTLKKQHIKLYTRATLTVEADVGGMAVKAEPSQLITFMLFCLVT